MNFLKRIFTKSKWETVFSGEVNSASGTGRLELQVERTKNLYRCMACSNVVSVEIKLSQIVKTFPEIMPILVQERITLN